MNRQTGNEEIFQEAEQLLRIARLELGMPLAAASCLIVGEGATADRLEQDLIERARLVARHPADGDLPFDLLVLLEQPKEGLLERFAADNGLVLDAATMKSGEWATQDPSARYRRIRILRLTTRRGA